jgi:hypothetical protein
MTEVQDDTIRLACWDCCAIYASPKNHPQCPNCGWIPERLVLTRGGEWCKWGRRAQSTWESRPQSTAGEALPWRGSFRLALLASNLSGRWLVAAAY